MTCSLPPKRPSLVEIGSLYAFKPCGPPFSARGRVVPLVLTLDCAVDYLGDEGATVTIEPGDDGRPAASRPSGVREERVL